MDGPTLEAVLHTPDEEIEYHKCKRDPIYFIKTYCWLKLESGGDEGGAGWVPFKLWGAQEAAVGFLQKFLKLIILKARQLGFTWVVVAYALWMMLFRAGSSVYMFSRGKREAVEMLDEKLKGMYDRLPPWMRRLKMSKEQNPHGIEAKDRENMLAIKLTNGSRAISFPTTAGRSYTASLLIVDEAEFIERFEELMKGVEACVNDGGQIVILSTVDKKKPTSLFKRMFRAAVDGLSGYFAVFAAWGSRPSRTQEWYDKLKSQKFAETGSHDTMAQEYPGSVEEALAPNTQDKRIPYEWLKACYDPKEPMTLKELEQVLPTLGIGLEIPEFEELYPP